MAGWWRLREKRKLKQSYTPIIGTFDRLAAYYGERGGMEEVNRRQLAPVIKEWEGRILDVGCGAGALIEKYINPGCHEVYTVDFSFNMICETCRRLGDRVGHSLFPVMSLAQALPFPRDCFDAVLAVNTLHNMPNKKDILLALAEMSRVLRPRGALLAEFRNIRDPERRRVTHHYDTPELPQKAFEVKDMTGSIRDLGFQVETVIPLVGDDEHSMGRRVIEEIGKRIFNTTPERAPRFAVLARKSPGFQSLLMDAAGFPVLPE